MQLKKTHTDEIAVYYKYKMLAWRRHQLMFNLLYKIISVRLPIPSVFLCVLTNSIMGLTADD